MNLRLKKIGSTLAWLALCSTVISVSAQESVAATITIEYDVNIQSFTDSVSQTTTSYQSPARHGSVSFSLSSPYSSGWTYPVNPSDPGPFTITRFSSPVTFSSPISDLIDADYYAQRFGNAWGQAQTDRAHRESDNRWDNFTARLSSGSTAGFVSSSYYQLLSLRKPWGDFVATGPDPYAVSASALVDYLLQAWTSGESLYFSEGFSVYDVLKLRNVEGFGYGGSAQITNVLVDNVSVRTNVPEPSTLLLCALGVILLWWKASGVRPREATLIALGRT